MGIDGCPTLIPSRIIGGAKGIAGDWNSDYVAPEGMDERGDA